jgi:hypothetical protein
MKTLVSSAIITLALMLAGCTAVAVGPAPYVEPIPGSITYKGQPRTKLTKSPIGSTFSHEFRIDGSTRAVETYRIAPDRSLQLIDRRIIRDWLFGRDD